MSKIKLEDLDVFYLEERIWLAVQKVGLTIYDFDFNSYFICRRPYTRPDKITAVGRFGATSKYGDIYQHLLEAGIELIHTPKQYYLNSDLTQWYSALQDLTPKSKWYKIAPTLSAIKEEFEFPIFIKGSRQTNKHKAELSIINSPEEYLNVIDVYKNDPILNWQELVIREFIKLRPVKGLITDKIPSSFEFRTFWWKGELVGAGPYWSAFATYDWTKQEKEDAIKIARQAVQRLNSVFIVIDIAQTIEGNWIVIECNDGQESGYNGISPIGLWQNIIELERNLDL